MMTFPVTQTELDTLYPALKEAVSKLKHHQQTPEEIDGALYTNIRRELQWKDAKLKKLFSRKKKYSHYTNNTDPVWILIQTLIKDLKMSDLNKDETQHDLMQLRVHLSSMRDGAQKMTELNKRAEKVAAQLVELSKPFTQDGDEDVG